MRRASLPTPIFNTPEIASLFRLPLPLDHRGFLLQLETIALPGTALHLEKRISEQIYQITTPAYSGPNYSSQELFVDIRFLGKEIPLSPSLPSIAALQKRLLSFIGCHYLWGGNWKEGLPQMLSLFPPPGTLNPEEERLWCLRGVDCSGLLYEAANGLLPRNTSDQVKMGRVVAPSGPLLPLDLLFYRHHGVGHVVALLDEATCIESRATKGGVVLTPLKERLDELQATHRASSSREEYFARSHHYLWIRWHPETLTM